MTLDELAGDLIATSETAPWPATGQGRLSGLTADSRAVSPGMVFVAVPGTKTDGALYAGEAERRGAMAIVAAEDAAISAGIPVLRVADPRRFLALSAARWHGLQPNTMVAVTGTAGKTSVATFAQQIWAHEGRQAAMIGTTGVLAPGRRDHGALTTPDPMHLHALLAELAGAGVTHAAMEASSHGLDQRRLDGVRLAAAAFTNLGRDHMDYHPSVEAYFAAKMRLFEELLPAGAPAVIFADDAYSDRAVGAAEAAGRTVLTVGRRGAFLSLKRVEHHRRRQSAEVHHDGAIYELDVPLAGDFQVSNALVAAGLAIATGSRPAIALGALEQLRGADGRLELVGTTDKGAPVYVDYAHKPDALEQVLAAVRPFTTGRVIVVFGCGGDRDSGKRPIMGAIAARLADIAIITDDNPRSEDPAAIRAEIIAGAPDAREIASRAEAIDAAVGMLEAGDTLIIAGKGHESGQTVGDVTHPFSDREEALKALEVRR